MTNKSSKRAQQLVWLPVGLSDTTDTAVAVTVPAGAAGSVVDFQILKRPLLNLAKGDIGAFGNSSVIPVTDTVFSNEVAMGTPNAELANGDYYIDYLTGKGTGKKATTGTSQRFTYSYFKAIMDVGAELADGQTNTKNPLLVGGEAQDPAALPTATTAGKIVRFLTDLSRRLIVTLGTKIAGESFADDVMKVEQQFNFTNITTATTTVVKAGSGYLNLIAINTPVAGATITLYDNNAASGPKIGTITFGATVLADIKPQIYQIKFNTGLTIVTSAGVDITVSSR